MIVLNSTRVSLSVPVRFESSRDRIHVSWLYFGNLNKLYGLYYNLFSIMDPLEIRIVYNCLMKGN